MPNITFAAFTNLRSLSFGQAPVEGTEGEV